MSLTHNWNIRGYLHDGCLGGKCCKTSSSAASPTFQRALYFTEHFFLPRADPKCCTKLVLVFLALALGTTRLEEISAFHLMLNRKLHKILVLFSCCKTARSVCILLSERLFVVFNNTLYFPKNMVKIRIPLLIFFFRLPCKCWRLRLK